VRPLTAPSPAEFLAAGALPAASGRRTTGVALTWTSTMLGLLTAVPAVCALVGLSSGPQGAALLRTWIVLGLSVGLALLTRHLQKRAPRDA